MLALAIYIHVYINIIIMWTLLLYKPYFSVSYIKVVLHIIFYDLQGVRLASLAYSLIVNCLIVSTG